MSSGITERMVRRWADLFIVRNERLPGAKSCAEHFCISNEEADELLRAVYTRKEKQRLATQQAMVKASA